jgi:hypothetical protein
MTQYAILLSGNEDNWAQATPEHRTAMYAKHAEFARLLEQRGHKVTGGAELTHSRGAKLVRGDLDDVTVTDGPYAETVEQLTGFYLVETDDVEDLMRVCGVLSPGGGTLEVRQTVDHSAS